MQPILGSMHLLALHCLLYAQHALVTRPFVPHSALPPSTSPSSPSPVACFPEWSALKQTKLSYQSCVEEFNRKPKLGLARMAQMGIASVWHGMLSLC
jgi:hypothetical protein